MAKDKQKKTKKALAEKKKWYTILAPDIFNKIPIGETIVSDPELIVDRQVQVNLMNLTRDVRQQNINVKFEVTKISNKDAETDMIGYEIAPSSIKRMIGRKITRIDESFVVFTSDKKKIRIKPLVITRAKLKKSVEGDMRKVIKSFVKDEIKKTTYNAFIKDLISNKFQKSLAVIINKIHPVRITTIRSMHIEKSPKKKDKAAEVEEQDTQKPEVAEEIKEEPKEEKVEEEPKKEEEQEKPKLEKKEKKKSNSKKTEGKNA